MSERSASWRPGQTVCRCCLAEGCYKDISTEYFWMGKREVYADMLLDTFDVNISFSQAGGPGSSSRLICEPCISRLRDASEFKRQVLECEKAFVQQLEPGSSTIDVDDGAITLTGSEIKVEAIKLEKSLSDDEDFHDAPNFDDDDDDLDDQPLTTYASRVPKKESVDILELLDTEKTAEKRKMPVRAKATSAKKLKAAPKTVVAKAATSKTATKTGKVDTKKKGAQSRSGRPRGFDDHRFNASLIINNSNICPFRWRGGKFGCNYCSMCFGDFSMVRSHVAEHRFNNDKFIFTKNCTSVKVDITDLMCALCNETLGDIEALKIHLISVHQIEFKTDFDIGVSPFLLNGTEYSCFLCQQTFENFTNLNYHMNTHSTTNICNICGKGFVEPRRLKTHMLTHTGRDKDIKCRDCKMCFVTKVERNAHALEAHGRRLGYKCPYCDESCRNFRERMRHMKEVHNSAPEYPCDMCTAVFALYSQRTRHINRVHLKLKTFFCTECPLAFVSGDILKSHMAIHSTERAFHCQICGKSFARDKTLKRHLKIHTKNDVKNEPYHSFAEVLQSSMLQHESQLNETKYSNGEDVIDHNDGENVIGTDNAKL